MVGSSLALPPEALKYERFGSVFGRRVMLPDTPRLALIWSMRGRAITRAAPTRRSSCSPKPKIRFMLGRYLVNEVPPETGTSIALDPLVPPALASTRWPVDDCAVCAACTPKLPRRPTSPSVVSRLNCRYEVRSRSLTSQFGGTEIDDRAVGNCS